MVKFSQLPNQMTSVINDWISVMSQHPDNRETGYSNVPGSHLVACSDFASKWEAEAVDCCSLHQELKYKRSSISLSTSCLRVPIGEWPGHLYFLLLLLSLSLIQLLFTQRLSYKKVEENLENLLNVQYDINFSGGRVDQRWAEYKRDLFPSRHIVFKRWNNPPPTSGSLGSEELVGLEMSRYIVPFYWGAPEGRCYVQCQSVAVMTYHKCLLQYQQARESSEDA